IQGSSLSLRGPRHAAAIPHSPTSASRHGGHRAKEVFHMAARSSWKGFLRLSLVTVPVKAFPASVSGGGDIHLHQLHAGCHQRIRYHKVCPLHGHVQSDAIVSGYEQTGRALCMSRRPRRGFAIATILFSITKCRLYAVIPTSHRTAS